MELQELLTEHADISRYPPERRILIAALDCIRDLGLEGATVRAIAARAGLNPASINYYYRSKDRVIEEALRGAWTHVADDIDLIIRKTRDPDAASGMAVRYLLEGSLGSPKVIPQSSWSIPYSGGKHPRSSKSCSAASRGAEGRARVGSLPC